MGVYKRPVAKDPWGQPDVVDLLARAIVKTRRDAKRPNRVGESMAAGRGDNGKSLITVGNLGDGTKGAHIRRMDGSSAFRVYTDPTNGTGFVGMFDAHGQYIVTDDSASGFGIARPYLPIPMAPYVPPLTGGAAQTTSGTWVPLLVGVVPLQHPVIMGTVSAQTATGVTAQLRVAIDGVQVGGVVTLDPGSWGLPLLGPAATASEVYGAFHTVTVDAQVTGGSGAVAVAPVSLYGVESAFLS